MKNYSAIIILLSLLCTPAVCKTNYGIDALCINKHSKKSHHDNQDKTGLKTYSKFDFIPGDKVIFFEDFMQDNIGDFPALWNTNGSGEVVNTNKYPGNWLRMNGGGAAFAPELKFEFDENITIEFDMIFAEEVIVNESMNLVLLNVSDDWFFGDYTSEYVEIFMREYGVAASSYTDDGLYFDSQESEFELIEKSGGKPVRVSIWIQKQRMRLYIDETKLLDLPRIIPKGVKFNKLEFLTGEETQKTLITNIRIATGLPDIRSKILNDGKFITRGITFDTGSDKIKPESFGVLKDIATVLNENPNVKVQIVGHTDSDGNDAENLTLSIKRAASVKSALQNQFGVATTQIETAGKGESEPISPNNTPEGKANNRRVEFIKIK